MGRSEEKVNLRLATLNEMKLLYTWVNDDAVRENSLGQKLISWEEHCEWYKGKLDSENCVIKIIYTEGDNCPVGQIRLDCVEEFTYITYSISKESRGKGYGYLGLKEALETWRLGTFRAVVKKSNVASRRIFEKLQFREILNGDCGVMRDDVCCYQWP